MPGFSTGMSEVIVRKDDLIAIVKQNRNEHRAIFEEALDAFKQQAERNLHELIDQVRRGNINAYARRTLVIPEEHTADYDRALRMLELHQGDTVLLSEEACQHLVDDDWGWKTSFATNTVSYTGRAKDGLL